MRMPGALVAVMLLSPFLRAAERPNFLFIYTDDQRYDALSVVQKEQGERGRFPWFQTPHMDRLAAEGARFRNAFVVCSLCAPSRAVNLTGRYNHLNGVASNFRPFPADNVTHAMPGLRLHFDFTEFTGSRVPDLSGCDNHGQVHNVTLVEGRNRRKVLRLRGDGWIDVPKSPSLDPADRAWTAEVVFAPEKPDGVILARGGRTQGYALWLDRGRPHFTVVTDNRSTSVASTTTVDDWAVVVGMITAGRKVALYVNGRLADEVPLPGLIGHNPSDAMQIGADLGSPVVEPMPPKFCGWIERVRLYSGEYTPERP